MGRNNSDILSQFGMSSSDLICPDCGSKMELEDYTCICKNCWTQLDISELADESDFYIDDIPEGCAACGGPYPDCKPSCPIFDD